MMLLKKKLTTVADIFSHQALTQNEMDGKPIAGIATLKVKLQLA